MITRQSDLSGVAFAVCTALSEQGLQVVLVGGSAATIYAPWPRRSACRGHREATRSRHQTDQALERAGERVEKFAAFNRELIGRQKVTREVRKSTTPELHGPAH